MAKPTHDEIIRELSKDVAVLTERLNAAREEVKDLKRSLEEDAKRRWALLPPVIGAVVNVVLSAIVAFVVSRLALR